MFNKIYDGTKKFIKENIKSIIILIGIYILFMFELPYCIYTPGGKVDLSKRVEVENGYKTKGEIDLTYVSMVKSSIPFLLLSYVMPNWDVQKQSDVTYKNLSMEETIEIDRLYMQQGINNSIISAYNLANKEYKIKDRKMKVFYIEKKSKSSLKIGDEILEVDKKKVKSIEEIKELLKDKKKDDIVIVKIKRDDKVKYIKSRITILDGEPKLGVATIDILDLKTTPRVKVKTKRSESGSSGGFMTSLAIYNSLVKEDITKGDVIMGTGTIDENGNVGEIDGVKYKLLGAAKKKADVFLCPKGNYKEAIRIKKKNKLKIEIKSIDTLEEAIEYLKSR